MPFITPELADSQVHADGVDVSMLEVYARAAERAAMEFLNRRVYETTEALNAARDALPAALASADTAYDAAREAANALTGSARCAALDAARAARDAALEEARATYAGIVITEDILSAMLLILGHLYRNREEVITGQGAAAVQLPMGAHSLLWPHRVGLGV